VGRYRHIIWDWNGTLLDDAQVCVDILNEILRKYSKPPVTYEQYRENFDFPVKDYYRRLGFDFAVESYEKLADEYVTAYNRKRFECRLQDGVVDTLETCRALGVTQLLLSAYNQKMLDEIVECFGIRHFFAKLVGLDDHYADSKLEAGRRLLKENGLDGRDVLLVGDTLHDHEVAQALGTDCVLVCNGHHPQHRLQSCGVRLLKCLAEVAALLR